MRCTEFRNWLDDYDDGSLQGNARVRLEAHLVACKACATERAGRAALRQTLSRMTAPEPRPGFVDSALARAIEFHELRQIPPAHRTNAMLRWLGRQRQMWLGAALGAAAAAGVAMWVVRPQPPDLPSSIPGLTLALEEAHEVGVLIDSERDLEDTTITVLVEGGIELVGFGDRRELRWQTDLDRGSNLLSLPVIARSLENGRLVAVIEYEGRTRRVVVDIKVRQGGTSVGDAAHVVSGAPAAG